MEFLKKLAYYLNPFAKRDPNAKGKVYLKAMHGINRISIYLFILALVVIVYRLLKGS